MIEISIPPETLDVSRETLDRLEVFARLLVKWTARINLVARSTLPDLWTRHVVDSIQVVRAAPDTGRQWVDLGTGGGFPGMVAAILAIEENPARRFTFIESDQRKAAFLRTAARETGASVKILAQRIESARAQSADILSARAVADLDALLGFAERHMSPSGMALFPKGSSWGKEVDKARSRWRFDLETITSVTDPQSVILKIEGVSRA